VEEFVEEEFQRSYGFWDDRRIDDRRIDNRLIPAGRQAGMIDNKLDF
jgi:hypothetical protein